MKSTALVLAAMTLAASTALAYVQPGHLQRSTTPTTSGPVFIPGDGNTTPVPGDVNTSPMPGKRRPPVGDPAGPTKPVPEPGTMVLASMGLIALGAAMRRRRH